MLFRSKFLRASATWPGGVPAFVADHGDAPAGGGGAVSADAVPVTLSGLDPFRRWDLANVVRGRANGTVSAYAHAPLGDLTSEQLRGLASLQRELAADVRITNRQNLVFRGLAEGDLPLVHERLEALGLGAPGAERSRDVVSCPGADTCNLAVTQSREIGRAHV